MKWCYVIFSDLVLLMYGSFKKRFVYISKRIHRVLRGKGEYEPSETVNNIILSIKLKVGLKCLFKIGIVLVGWWK